MTIAARPLQDWQDILRYLNVRFQRPGRDDGWIRPLGLHELSEKKHSHQCESDSLQPDHIHRKIPFRGVIPLPLRVHPQFSSRDKIDSTIVYPVDPNSPIRSVSVWVQPWV